VTLRRLEDDVDRALASGAFDPAQLAELPDFSNLADLDEIPGCPEGVQIGARPMGGGETHHWVANVPADVARLFRACLCSVQRRLSASPGPALEAMFLHCIDTWRPRRVPREQRVFERDGWRCTVPGCTSLRNLHAHHVVFRSAGGSDDDANLTTLCAAHHQRGVHAGVIRISGRAPDGLVFELPVGRFGSGDLVLPPAAGPI
jgi:5-methylcytosine-specific restriction endonuclease McrA